MATRKTKNGDSEKLDSATIERVIKLLEDEKPITKKDACNILNIAYNTTRLSSIIDKYKEKKERDRQRRSEKRGKPLTNEELSFIISSYLEGSTIDHISSSIFRSPLLIKQTLDQYSVPIRARAHNYFKPELIPDEAVREVFDIGETVYSARYDSTAKVVEEYPHPEERVYRVWLNSDKWQQYAYQPASELASLKHLRDLGVRI